jgi:chemotaxis protein MotB
MPKLKELLQQAIRQMSDFEKLKNHIEMTVTTEGLRIELTESAKGTFFDSGRPELNRDGSQTAGYSGARAGQAPQQAFHRGPHRRDALRSIPKLRELGTLHRPCQRSPASDAGNGIRPDQVMQVRGFADQRLRKPTEPLDPANRRISLIVQYIMKNDDDDAKPAAPSEGATAPPNSPAPTKPSAAKE